MKNQTSFNNFNKIVLEEHEVRAIKSYIYGFWERENSQSVISETMLLYYKKRMTHTFKTYDDTLKWLKVASKYGRLKSNSLLNDGNPNRIIANKKYIKEIIWEEENKINGGEND